ncbi:MAG: aromatic amino acid lyase [Alphaproteobacteria bacterium]
MTVTIRDRRDFSLDNVCRVAIGGEKVRFAPAAMGRMTKAYEAFQTYVDTHRDRFIYGVTSGGGPTAKVHKSPEEMRRLHARGNPFTGLSFARRDLPPEVVRASVFAMLAMYAEGTNAVEPGRAKAVAKLLDGDLPRIPEQGLVVPGEILARFFLVDLLPPRARKGFEIGGANGSPFTNGMGALAAVYAGRRLALAERVFALSVEAFNAPLEAYDPALKALWGDPYEGQALDALGRLLKGARTKDRRFYQAPVSWRILPRVLGQAHRAQAQLADTAAISMRVIASNPTYVPPAMADRKRDPHGKTMSTGSYHNAILPPAMDAMAASWVDLAELARRHAIKLHRGDISQLPDLLIPEGQNVGSPETTAYLEWVPFGFVEEMRRLAEQPAGLLSPVEPAASEQDDISAPGEFSWLMERRVAHLFDHVLVVTAVSASQALHLMKRRPAPPLRRFLDEIREIFPPAGPRALAPDATRLTEGFTEAVEGAAGFGLPSLGRRPAAARRAA